MVERRSSPSERLALQKEVNRLFEHLAHFESTGADITLGEWFPSVDVLETKDTLVIKIETPGMSKNELSVVCHGHKLVVSGEKRQMKEDQRVHSYLCLERGFGRFERTIYIEQAVQMKKATATLGDGVLTINMPKLKDRRGSEFHLHIQDEEEGRGK